MNENQMKLLNLRTIERDGEVEISVDIDSAKLGHQKLWFSTPQKYAHGLCHNRMDGFLVGMLFPAMQYGEDIHLYGCVSHKLLFNINNYVIPLLSAFSPSSKRIKVTADETSSERYDAKGVGTGFSAGVDSFCVIYDRLELENSPDYKINSFLFLNVGSHGWGESEEKQAYARRKFIKRYDYLQAFPKELGLAFIPLDSNLHKFHPWGHLKTDTLTSTAGILIMQGWFKRYYYGTAGFSYSDQITYGDKFREVSVADCCDPMIAPLLATESLDLILDGMQYKRNDKLSHIIEYPPVKKFLNVCVGVQESHENCSVCGKCSRTLMALDALGKIEEFSHLFNINKYRKKSQLRYTSAQVLRQKNDPFARANIQLALSRGLSIPSIPIAKLIHAYYSLKNNILFNFFELGKKIISEKNRNLIKDFIQKN
jgi:hypothetical protein